MKVTVSREKFHTEWESTGKMIKEKEGVFAQTYEHPRFGEGFSQRKVNTPFGVMIELTN